MGRDERAVVEATSSSFEDFDDYVSRCRSALQRFATAVTGDAYLAEEILQDVLLRAFGRWESIALMDHPHAYVRRMIVHQHVSWRRRWSRVEPRAVVPEVGSVADSSESHADRVRLIAEITRLPARQRAVLAMRYFEDLADTDIADTLGCSPATVRSIAARALAKLRINMDEPATDTSRNDTRPNYARETP